VQYTTPYLNGQILARQVQVAVRPVVQERAEVDPQAPVLHTAELSCQPLPATPACGAVMLLANTALCHGANIHNSLLLETFVCPANKLAIMTMGGGACRVFKT